MSGARGGYEPNRDELPGKVSVSAAEPDWGVEGGWERVNTVTSPIRDFISVRVQDRRAAEVDVYTSVQWNVRACI
ncbi:Hypothetical protein SMAX5B_009039 [Scophthalmus maximus]|uniref:Uncharacterized protein n=1 Tax=Scophthalmus maximus TaxID=52904 RepID=A0A2U9CI37_SCOMX|nr:Hypothetical protein SMAX5B_009039 [Scophthalmus maximus]